MKRRLSGPVIPTPPRCRLAVMLIAGLTLTLTLILQSASVRGVAQAAPDAMAQARSLLSAGQLAAAEALLRRRLAGSPSNPEVHYLLGLVLFREQRATESLAEFTAGASFRRPVAGEFKVIASDYILLGDYEDADRWFTEVVKEDPGDDGSWYLLGRTKFNENDFEGARSDFEHVLALNPRHIEAENNLGLTWKELNRMDRAQAAFQAAIEWQANLPVDAQPYLNLGALLIEQDRVDDALPYLAKAETLAPENPRIHEELAGAYAARQDLARAQSELERAVALAPEISGLHFKLGQIYRREGLHDRAQQEFAVCSRLNSTHSSRATPNPLTLGEVAPR